ncbi:aminotransferase class I and II family protein [Mycobacterium kansasii]|uniref:Aminotransferase class I and II family protein n=1 Tax=Mycobacterium kansasii TaxID=1768 RepID=A0A1V3X1Y1_MYCKA|nr:aminotransferase class I and II family protein [Mycobacterium kansasii]
MTHRVARRAGIPPFHVMDVWLAAAERQRTHGDLVNLSAGQPSAGAPEPVRAAAAAALHLNQLGYTVALGIPELRAAIAADYERQHGITVGPDAVVVTTGSSGGFLLTFLACFDVGDRVAMASPAIRVIETSCRRWDVKWWRYRAGPRPGFSPPCRCSPNSTRRCRGWSWPARPIPPAP